MGGGGVGFGVGVFGGVMFFGVVESVVTTVASGASGEFARRQLAALPWYLRAGVAAAAAGFAADSYWRNGRGFAALPVAEREAQIARWRGGRFEGGRKFVMLCEGLAWFSHYARDE